MKTKELIALLQKEDPSGEIECCIDKTTDILCIYKLLAYYDGHLELLIRDEPSSAVIGFKTITKGEKISINSYSFQDSLWDNPEMPIECNDKHYKQEYEKMREEVKEELKEIGKELKIRDITKHHV